MKSTVDLDQAVFFVYPDADTLKSEYEAQKDHFLSKTEFVDTKTKSFWSQIQEIYNKVASEYFWHDEGIHWEVVNKTADPFDFFVHGKVRFGDGMEDEWFLVRFLMALTASNTLLSASIFDTDGDFILIEAADVIPDWLEPENSKNRVFINRGSVKIIPNDLFKVEPKLKEALKFIQSDRIEIDEKVTRVIKAKVSQNQKLHLTKVRIPLRILQVLNGNKQLVGPAISSFYNRQPEDMRICTEMPHFNPGKTGGPLVITTLPMTRIQFAQLACQEFVCPANDSVDFGNCEPENAIAAELGMKLTCGFEILMNTTEPKYVSRNLFDNSVSVQVEIENILKSPNPDFTVNSEPEDNLDWMEIGEDALNSELETKFDQTNMTEMEQSELINTWTREFDSGSGKVKEELSEIDQIVEKMKKMIESASNYEGIENENSEIEDEESSCESEYSDSESDEELLEREIFETINFDPDLLMKILEANAQMGVSSEEFLVRFTKYQRDHPETDTGTRSSSFSQKGLADIDGVKIEEAKRGSRKVAFDGKETVKSSSESDEEYEKAIVSNTTADYSYYEDENDRNDENVENHQDVLSDVEVADEFMYGQTLDQLKQSIITEPIEQEDLHLNPDIDNDHSMQEYYDAMDTELQSSMIQSKDSQMLDEESNLGKNLIESLAAAGKGAASPIETVLSGLGKRVPRPSRQ